MKSPLVALSLGTLLNLQPVSAGLNNAGEQEPLRAAIDPLKYRAACPDYKNYAMRPQYVKRYRDTQHVLMYRQSAI